MSVRFLGQVPFFRGRMQGPIQGGSQGHSLDLGGQGPRVSRGCWSRCSRMRRGDTHSGTDLSLSSS